MRPLWIVVLASVGMFLCGCSEEPRPASEEPTPANAATDSQIDLTSAEIDSLAAKQKVCAVTGEELGGMGTPVPVRVTDSAGAARTVLICCESCREELLSDPDKYLARIAPAEPDAKAP